MKEQKINKIESAREDFQRIYKYYTEVKTGKWTEQDEINMKKEMAKIEKRAYIEAIAIAVIFNAIIISSIIILICIARKVWGV